MSEKWQTVNGYTPKPSGADVPSINISVTKGGNIVWVNVNRAGIAKYFFRDFENETFSVQWRLDAKGNCIMRIANDPDGTAVGLSSMKGSGRIMLKTDDFGAYLPREQFKSEPCRSVELEKETNAVILLMPTHFSYQEQGA